MATATATSICRSCTAFCPILVDVEDGRALRVRGDPAAREYGGYTCPKGRALPELTNDPSRLLHSLRRDEAGNFQRIAPDEAVSEIGDHLLRIIADYGPRSVAMYLGNGSGLQHPFSAIMAMMLFRKLGSPMVFTASTIDKPAEKIAAAMHGYWMGGAQGFADADVWMILGGNPVISKSNGLPSNNPAQRLKEEVGRGLKLILVDPKRTEVARRAAVHLQAKPGEDPSILAGMIRIIIDERLYDAQFIEENVAGFDALRQAVSPFTVEYVAARAGIDAADLLAAARTFGRARRGMAVCSTGPSFSTHSNASFYLALCLNTICGRWARADERALYSNVLLPAFQPIAQALEPYSVYGETPMRVMGLQETVAGMPSAALADEILLEGEGKVRALICLGGNPARAFPDQHKIEAALSSLDLLVTLDAAMSATASFSHFVIAPPMTLELPALTYLPETLKYQAQGRGFQMPWAQYAPAAVEPPPHAELLAEHAFFFRLAKTMGLRLDWINHHGLGKYLEAPTECFPLDMDHEPSLDELFELATRSARVPLSEVKKHPHGHCFEEDIRVAPREPGWRQRLAVDNPMIMKELSTIRRQVSSPQAENEYPLLLVSHRANNTMNSIGTSSPQLMKGHFYNPLLIHPDDARQLGIADAMPVEICSRHARVTAIARLDESLRRGVVAMTHGFGVPSLRPETDPRRGGTNVNRLIPIAEYDALSGIPRMSGLPVSIAVLDPAKDAASRTLRAAIGISRGVAQP